MDGVRAIRMRKIAVTVIVLSCAIALAQWDAEYLRRNPPPPWSSVEQMHSAYVEKFIQSSGFGVSRMTQDLRNYSELVLNGQHHVVEKVELIGLVKHPAPTAYLTFSTPPQKRLLTNEQVTAFIKTRALTTFETNALVELRNGRNEIVGAANGAPAILGGVRARKDCLKCHDGKAGNLLGALSYTMALSRKPAVPASTNNVAPTNPAPQFSSR